MIKEGIEKYFSLWGLPFITSALRGEGVPSKADIESNLSKGWLREYAARGGGVKKIRNFCGCPKWMPFHRLMADAAFAAALLLLPS